MTKEPEPRRETPILRLCRDERVVISGRAAPVEIAQPVVKEGWCSLASVRVMSILEMSAWEMSAGGKRRTEWCLDVSAHEPVAAVAGRVLLSQAGDPAFCQANADVDLACTERGDHVARSGRKGDQLGIEAEVLLCEVNGRRKVLWHVSYSK